MLVIVSQRPARRLFRKVFVIRCWACDLRIAL